MASMRSCVQAHASLEVGLKALGWHGDQTDSESDLVGVIDELLLHQVVGKLSPEPPHLIGFKVSTTLRRECGALATKE